MINKSFRLPTAILTVAIMALNSCSRDFYVPSSKNVPLHNKQGDVRVNGYLGSTENSSDSKELQASVALTDHIGIQYNFMYADGGDVNKRTSDYGYGKQHEFGIGYFAKISKNLQWELYGGYGQGYQFHYWKYDNELLTNRFNHKKFYLQPAIGLSYKFIQVYGYLGINRVLYNRYPILSKYYSSLPANEGFKYTLNTIEPGIGFRFGLKNVKIDWQFHRIGYPNYFSNNVYTVKGSSYSSYKTSIGISVNLNTLKLFNKLSKKQD